MSPRVTICILTYGDHLALARQAIESVTRHCPRGEYHLVVGANEVAKNTLVYLKSLEKNGAIDRLVISAVNINKNPMMRRMFEGIDTPFIWWFDDDSYFLDSNAFSQWLEMAEGSSPSTVMWGPVSYCSGLAGLTGMNNVPAFVRSAPWYRGLPVPSWRFGGKGEVDFRDCGCGDGRWSFVLGGCFLIRTTAVRALNWPDERLVKWGDDIFLGEAIRQQQWEMGHIATGVAVDTEQRRGDPGPANWDAV